MAEMIRHIVGEMTVSNADILVGRAFCIVHSDDCSAPGCDGRGHLQGACPTCGGSRLRPGLSIRDVRRGLQGGNLAGFVEAAMCPDCHGSGRLMCPNARHVTFTVPEGVREGWVLEGTDERGGKHWGVVTGITQLPGVPAGRRKGRRLGLVLLAAAAALAIAGLLVWLNR